MKYAKILGVACIVCIWLSGCSNDKIANTEDQLETQGNGAALSQEFSNLDVSEIAEDIELPEHLYEMKSRGEGGWNDDKIYKEFPQLIEAYGGTKASELDCGKDILFETWIDNRQLIAPLDQRDKETIWDILYCSDSLYISMDRIRQLFVYHPDEVERITGEPWDRQQVWIPDENADPVAVYDMEKDDITGVTYQLDGQEVSLEESVEFVEKQLKDNKDLPDVSTPGFDYRVDEVQVYQFGDNFCYYFIVALYYKGVKLDNAEGSLPVKGEDGKYLSFIQSTDKCAMFSQDKLSGIYIYDWLNEEQDSVQEVECNITYQKALQILSDYLSADHVFKVLDAELVYNFYVEYEKKQDQEEEGTNRIVPNWQFELSTEGMQQYNRIYIMINVQTGAVIERYA